MKKIDLVQWNNSLQPYQKFFDTYKAEEWKMIKEFEIPLSLDMRLRLIVERPEENQIYALDVGRAESLGEKGIYASDTDADELAQVLFNSVFEYLSVHEMEAVVKVLQTYIESHNVS